MPYSVCDTSNIVLILNLILLLITPKLYNNNCHNCQGFPYK